MRRALRRLARAGLALAAALSLAGALLAAQRIAQNPLAAPLVEAGTARIRAATDRMLAIHATPQALAEKLAARLAEDPRDWLVIDALTGLAAERGLPLPPDLATDLARARAADFAPLARAADCALCAWDAASCTLAQVAACQLPVALTPVGDVLGLARAATAAAAGTPVDRVDLALSVAGLSASALVLATGGSAAAVKAGAGLARVARAMDLVSPRLAARAAQAARSGVDWAALPAARGADDLARALRPQALAPLTALAADLGRIQAAAGPARALHLMPLIDDAADARRLARAAEALGPRITARAELLGKARLMRATLRWSNLAAGTLAAVAGLALSLAGLAASLLQGAGLRLLRRLAA